MLKYRIELSQMRKERERISCALWRQMSNILKFYVQQTDVRRSHLAELQRLDSEGKDAIFKNQQLIQNEEDILVKLKHEYTNLVDTKEEEIRTLENTIKTTTVRFFKMRKSLCFEINHDEKQLAHLTNVSNKVIDDMEKISDKGNQILQFVRTCRKLETDREKINRWSPFIEEDDVFTEGGDNESSFESVAFKLPDEDEGNGAAYYKQKYSWEAFEKELEEETDSSGKTSETSAEKQTSDESFDAKINQDEKKEVLIHSAKSPLLISKIRPKTAVARAPRAALSLRHLKSEEIFKRSFTSSQEDKIFQISTRVVKTITTTIKPATQKFTKARSAKSAIFRKSKTELEKPSVLFKSEKTRSFSAPKFLPEPEGLKFDRPLKSAKYSENNFEVLDKLEGVWWIYNKVEMECMKMRKEKKVLLRENNKLKDVIKDVLEAAALGQSIPNVKSASTTTSRRRFVLSAPLSTYSLL